MTIQELVDELPDQALDLYVWSYERGLVGDYFGFGFPDLSDGRLVERGWRRCPRCALGYGFSEDRPGYGMLLADSPHPADRIERMGMHKDLDLSELYTACVLSLMERDGATVEVVERETVGAC